MVSIIIIIVVIFEITNGIAIIIVIDSITSINIIIAKVINVAINIISNKNSIINHMIAAKIFYIISNVAIHIITIYMIIAKVANAPH